MRNVILAVSISWLMLSAVRASRAQDEAAPAVARLSLIEGEASVLRGDDTTSWVSAAVNTPLVTGDSVFAALDSRVEIQLDRNNVLRLAGQTQVRIASLTEDRIQIEVSQGLIDFVILDASWGEGSSLEPNPEIDMPGVAARPLVPGVYRIQVDSDSQGQITVRQGRVEVSSPEGSITFERGTTIAIRGTDSPEYRTEAAEPPDDWDRWNEDRDRAIHEAQSWQYANRYYVGAGDLDVYGEWIEVPGYNWCWTPHVNVGWVPYANGHWVWKPFWAWTWVSDEPWGWAPYHYGRWFWRASRWVWWPGPSAWGSPPEYAPAYVTFLGFGFSRHDFNFGHGYGYRQIGWVPLGPSDYCYPWWGRPNTYRSTTIYNATKNTHLRTVNDASNASDLRRLPPLASAQQPPQSNIATALSNPRVRESIGIVSVDSFVKGQVTRQRKPVDPAMLPQAHVLNGTLPIVPTSESMHPSDPPLSRSTPPVAVANGEHFFSNAPSAAPPRPFKDSVAEIRQMISQPYPPRENRTVPRSNAGNSSGGDWRVTGAASKAAGDRQVAAPTPAPPTATSGKPPRQFVKQGSETQEQDRVTGGTPAAPSQDLPEGRPIRAGESRPTNPADTQGSESASSPGSLSYPGDKSGAAGSNQQTGPVQASRPGLNRFTPPSTGGTFQRRSAAPEEAMRGRNPDPKADAQTPKADFEAPRVVPARGSAGEGSFAHDESAAKPSRDDSVARPVQSGHTGSYRPLDEKARVPVRPEPRTETARPAPPQVEREAPQVRTPVPAPRNAPSGSTNKKS